ncbi:exodeoxyribonuclease V subunit alpha [Glaciecola sp. KUL10]|uniref:exodeoxyribonuclease V subunit alpha n=1 Tax=Glaciecola sp. (strain KUL10) TaxID=2161813 RepID=UPI000D78B814|nr:exodeoxyribonuclease V subunit alpha [Glaciecola sp. KUL10]GBL05936.1 exodeoxyribonuclease V, alpha subunit [Glaciecola sp. KUL10]
MNWQTRIKSFAGVSASEAVLVDRILTYYPYSASGNNENEDILFALLLSTHQHLQQGNTCLPIEKIANQRLFASAPHGDLVELEIDFKAGICMPESNILLAIFEQWTSQQNEVIPYIVIDNKIIIQRYYQYEQDIARYISNLSTQTLGLNQIEQSGKDLFNDLFPIQSSIDLQAIAAANALRHSFMILNGGPGTGKTHTIARILVLLTHFFPNKIIQLAAPTGKAAQRLSESLSKNFNSLAKHEEKLVRDIVGVLSPESITLHRLLGASIGKTSTLKNEQRKIACDILIIDEFSMVDVALFTKTLKACKPGIQIILVGDTAQLPSVEAGNLLSDLCRDSDDKMSDENQTFIKQFCRYDLQPSSCSAYDHIVTLKQNRRSNQSVNKLASSIVQQDFKKLDDLLAGQHNSLISKHDCSESDFYNELQRKISALLNEYQQALVSAKSPKELLNEMGKFKVLSPVRKGKYGVEGLNKRICQHLCSLPAYVNEINLFHGQAIIIVENDYSNNLHNGDIGVIWDKQHGKSQAKELIAVIERENAPPLELSINRLPKFESAFALTIHKTQGSEYNTVLIILPFGNSEACTKELLYTGVTRAKQQVDIVATKQVLMQSLNRTNQRDTMLRYCLELSAN